jgi:hypothetical protein
LRCDTWRCLKQRCAAIRKCDNRKLGYDLIDRPQRRERERTLFHDLGFALGCVLHGHDHASGTQNKVHRPAHAGHHLARNHPLRETSLRVHLIWRNDSHWYDMLGGHHNRIRRHRNHGIEVARSKGIAEVPEVVGEEGG